MKDLNEAIQHYKEKAAELREYSDVLSETSTTPKGKEISDCLECAEEHEQLAEWLTELKALKERPQGDLTEAEKKICKIYLEDLDKTHTCNEYTLLMNLIDNASTISDSYNKGFREGYSKCITDIEERKENNRLFQKGGAE